jgi:hypothetical protein
MIFTKNAMEISDIEWELLRVLLGIPPKFKDGLGRSHKDIRSVLNSVLGILPT